MKIDIKKIYKPNGKGKFPLRRKHLQVGGEIQEEDGIHLFWYGIYIKIGKPMFDARLDGKVRDKKWITMEELQDLYKFMGE